MNYNKQLTNIQLKIDQQCFNVIGLVGEEKLSDLPYWQVDFITEQLDQLLESKKTIATLIIAAAHEKHRQISATITNLVIIRAINSTCWQAQIVIEPQFYLSRYHYKPDVFLQKNVLECVAEIFHQYDPTINLTLNVTNTYHRLSFVLHHPYETDFAFVQRLLAKYRIFYYFQFTQKHRSIVLCDNNYSCPYDNTIYHCPTDFYDLQFHQDENNIIGKSNISSLYPGLKISIDIAKFSGQAEIQHYMITAVTHSYNYDHAYENYVTMRKINAAHQSQLPQKNTLPANLLATIVSHSDDAELNTQGYYRLRFGFSAKISPPIPMLLPNHEMHAPLHNNTKAIVGFINADPDQPIIIGSINSKYSPATCRNPQQNIYQTHGGHRLLFDDNNTSISLANANDINAINFDLTKGITLQSHGDIKMFSQYNISSHSNKSINEMIGHNKLCRFNNDFKIQSLKGEIAYLAGRDQYWLARKNIQYAAQQTIQCHAQTSITISTQQSLTLASLKGCINLQSAQSLQIASAKNINIIGSGDGNINIGNIQAGITILADGSMIFYGDSINFKAEKIIQRGVASYNTNDD